MTTAQTEAQAIVALVAEMRTGLELATKGEWSVDGYNTSAIIFRQHGKTHVTDWMRLARCDDDNDNWKADAAHIARCSPDNIRALLSRLDAAESENTRLAAELAEARKVVEPFAAMANMFDDIPPPKYFGDRSFSLRHPDSTKISVELGLCRAARAWHKRNG